MWTIEILFVFNNPALPWMSSFAFLGCEQFRLCVLLFCPLLLRSPKSQAFILVLMSFRSLWSVRPGAMSASPQRQQVLQLSFKYKVLECYQVVSA